MERKDDAVASSFDVKGAYNNVATKPELRRLWKRQIGKRLLQRNDRLASLSLDSQRTCKRFRKQASRTGLHWPRFFFCSRSLMRVHRPRIKQIVADMMHLFGGPAGMLIHKMSDATNDPVKCTDEDEMRRYRMNPPNFI